MVLIISSFTTSCTRFSEFDSRKVILLQIKIFGRNIKENILARYFSKITLRPNFTQLRVIRQINRAHSISKWKASCKDLVVSNFLAPTDSDFAFFCYILWIFSPYQRKVLSECSPSAIVNRITILV